ncbi:MAG: Ig-like domain-containing protein [Fermentimonas sp.]|jgi:uncharacterized protein (DUF2141 family)
MFNKILSFLSTLFLLLLCVAAIHSCANMASPTGGPYDVDPPKVKRASPDFNSLNVTPSRIEIEFDENIKVEKPTEKVIVTPPQKNMPVIRSIGKKAVVELKDTLLLDVTYTIDFTDAIVDNNEGNPLENFVYSFSTGDQLDTLAISGRVLNAEDLEPVTGIYVGIHSNLDDTAFTKVTFERISRTDSRGNFTVRGMAPGRYRVFALNDQNRDYKYDNPLEAVAFLDTVVEPSTTPAVRQDTVFADSITVDTILTVHYTRFLPDDLLLRTFLSDFQRRYLQKHERPEERKLELFFASPTDVPTFFLMNPKVEKDDWYVMERSKGNDTITLWITDSLIYKQDSLQMVVNYLRTDSLNMDYIATDTLNFFMRRSRQERRQAERAAKEAEKEAAKAAKEKEQAEEAVQEEKSESAEDEAMGKEGESEGGDKAEPEKEQPTFLAIQSNIQGSFELYNPIRIEFEHPVIVFDSTHVELSIEVDSLYETVPFRLETDSLNPRKFVVRTRWEPGAKYKFRVDSATIFNYYGLWNDTYEQSFTVKALDQYGNLEITLSGLQPDKEAFVELLDKSGKPFRKSSVKSNVARFQDLPPGEVYARLIVDYNGDGVWTTGNYEEQRQPEEVYYYPGLFTIREYSDHSESWDIRSKPVIEQKPLEITTNKPQEKKRNPNLDRQNEQRQGQQSSPFSGMGGGRGGGRGGGTTMQPYGGAR